MNNQELHEKRIEEFMKKRELRKKNLIIKLKKIFDYTSNIIVIFSKVIFIALVSGLAGAKSLDLIYKLNQFLGYDYAYYASYIESALISAVLTLYMFKIKGEKQ
jgi:hypothetical protein